MVHISMIFDVILGVQIRRVMLSFLHETFLEHILRSAYQKIKWSLPIEFMSKSTRVEIMYDRKTLEFAKEILLDDSTVVDIGANNGSMLSRLIKLSPQGIYFAFEPIPFFARYLKIKYPNVDVREIALSDTTGSVDFVNTYLSPALSSLDYGRIESLNIPFKVFTVASDTLDNQFLGVEKVDFIKIDVEGNEFKVLSGAVDTLSKFSPYLVIEVSQSSEGKIRDFLVGLSYEVTYLLDDKDLIKLRRLNRGLNAGRSGLGYIKAVPKIFT